MNIELITQDENKILQLNNIKFSNDNGNADLYVFSRGFSVKQTFYFDSYYLHDFIQKLEEINKTLVGKAILKDQFEKDYISIESDKLGHVIVEGKVLENSEYQQHYIFRFQLTRLY